MKFQEHIKVTNTGEHYETKIIAGNHILTTDEPLDHDGLDKGPTAHQMLLSSLGACTAITLRMYADRKAWDLKKIHVILNMEKVIVEGEEITKIFQKIELEGNLDEEQRNRLMIISTKCPVHKTLVGKVEIVELPK